MVFIGLFAFEVYVYRVHHKVFFNDLRVLIFLVNSFYCVILFINWSTLKSGAVAILFPYLEIFRILIFYLVFYYFMNHSDKLLKNGFVMKKFMNMLLTILICIFLMSDVVIIVGTFAYFNDDKNSSAMKINPNLLCTQNVAWIMRFMPLFVSFMYFIIFRMIKTSVKSQ